MNPYVVIDIGGTSIKYGLADDKRATPRRTHRNANGRLQKEDLTFLTQQRKS